jgi:hypothetical protein
VSPAESNTLWRDLVMDVYSRDNGMPDRIRDSGEAQANFTSDIEETLASTAPMRLLDRLRYSLRDKTFCKTTNCGFTWVHGDPKVGDYIFFARRATFPLIIQPIKGDKRYRSIKKAFYVRRFYRCLCTWQNGR